MVGLGAHQETHVKLLLAESAEAITQQLSRRDERIDALEDQLRSLQNKARLLEIANNELFFYHHLIQRRLDDLDQYSRRLNLIIRDFPQQPNESPDTICAAILRDIKKLTFNIQDIEVSRAHRHGVPHLDADGIKKQACIVRFIS